MKKIIIVAALVLTSAVTAFSLTTKTDNKVNANKLKEDAVTVSVKSANTPKADVGSAD
ncbi:hypothetical protein NAF17_03070 [Mucilaginibacter sp. RB4R14]|uniref:hypothetical protein n=1 Tax=Mucilaginibacter aurantiaciroseus TaxID=2949308 RepID=UPI002090FF1E|nr:hypothetical protein [Mucilaginibacter aurantiaciroseus]MCO5934511.1 hypothetical protein [Mucilaginibacter aurantiaciroseus]